MANKPDVSGYERFSDVTSRLDEIISAVRNKDTSLERSLDLFDEAIALGTRAVDLVDKAAFSPEEEELMADVDTSAAGEGAQAEGADAQSGAVQPAGDADASAEGVASSDGAPSDEKASS